MRGNLSFWTVLDIAVRNLRRNITRSVFSLAAIAIGVAGLILSGGFVEDLIFQLAEALIHSRSGHIQIARAGYFESGTRSPAKYLLTPEDIQRINNSGSAHVRETMRRISFSALLSNGRSSYPVLGEGIEPEAEARLGTYLVLQDGRDLTPNDRHGALVGAGLARAMQLQPGSVISLVATTVDGAMNTADFEVVGIFQSFSKDYDDRAVKVPLDEAQRLLDTDAVNVMVVVLDATANTRAVAAVMNPIVQQSRLELKTWDWLNDFYVKTVALYDGQFGILRLIILVMVILAVVGAINTTVTERIGEFGTMKALGGTGWDVMHLIFTESALMGVVGALAGSAIGLAAAWAISKVGIPMPPPPNSNLEFTAHIRLVPAIIGGAFAIGLSATLLASVVPALRVSRLPIVEALRHLV